MKLFDGNELGDIELLDALASIDDTELAREGREYVTGLQKIEPRELSRVDLPDWFSSTLRKTIWT